MTSCYPPSWCFSKMSILFSVKLQTIYFILVFFEVKLEYYLFMDVAFFTPSVQKLPPWCSSRLTLTTLSFGLIHKPERKKTSLFFNAQTAYISGECFCLSSAFSLCLDLLKLICIECREALRFQQTREAVLRERRRHQWRLEARQVLSLFCDGATSCLIMDTALLK